MLMTVAINGESGNQQGFRRYRKKGTSYFFRSFGEKVTRYRYSYNSQNVTSYRYSVTFVDKKIKISLLKKVYQVDFPIKLVKNVQKREMPPKATNFFLKIFINSFFSQILHKNSKSNENLRYFVLPLQLLFRYLKIKRNAVTQKSNQLL